MPPGTKLLILRNQFLTGTTRALMVSFPVHTGRTGSLLSLYNQRRHFTTSTKSPPTTPTPPHRADETLHLPASVAVVVGHQCYGDSMVPGAGWVLPTNQIPCWCLEQTGSCQSAITTTPAPAPHLVSNSNLEINLGSSQLPVETSEAETQ